MSVRVMGEVWGLNLPKALKFTLLALADHADHDGRNAFPGVGLLAWKLGDDRRTVQRNLRRLEALGLLEAVAYSKGGHGRATVYTIHTDKGDKLPPHERP